MDNLISRQAVLDLFKEYQPQLAVKVYEFGERLKTLEPAPAIKTVYDIGYKDGLEKAWEMAVKIFTPQRAYEEAYGRDELDIIFGEGFTSFDLAQMTVFEVMDKVDFYEKKKAEKDKIKDGDEVILDDGTKGVVVFSSTDGHLNIVNAYGGMRSYIATQVIKTGRHFPQMVEMMKEMRDNDG